MESAMIKIMPIVLLISLGYIIRKKRKMSHDEMNGLKKIVVGYALPAVLFSVFLELELKPSYIGLTIVLLAFCTLLLGTGFIIRKLWPGIGRAFPYILPGFSFGLIGIALYVTAFPDQPVAEYAVFGIGHELFIWLVLVTVMKVDLRNQRFSIKTLLAIFKSPLILAVLFGLGMNLLDIKSMIGTHFIFEGFYSTVNLLKLVGTPVILIYSGYGLVIDVQHVKKAFIYMGIRRLVVYGFGALFVLFLFPLVMKVDMDFMKSWLLFIMIGPPLSLSMFVGLYGEERDAELINNAVVLDTLLSVISYIVLMLIIN